MQMLGGRGAGGSASYSADDNASSATSRAPAMAEGPNDFDDDIPF
jgi:hypothetical protein